SGTPSLSGSTGRRWPSRCACAPVPTSRAPRRPAPPEPPDPRFSAAELEWVTKEKGATVLYGLLVRVE
ncbi:unnamed protein product, partial [Natator depressus]